MREKERERERHEFRRNSITNFLSKNRHQHQQYVDTCVRQRRRMQSKRCKCPNQIVLVFSNFNLHHRLMLVTSSNTRTFSNYTDLITSNSIRVQERQIKYCTNY